MALGGDRVSGMYEKPHVYYFSSTHQSRTLYGLAVKIKSHLYLSMS
jgi:hypothetical protein